MKEPRISCRLSGSSLAWCGPQPPIEGREEALVPPALATSTQPIDHFFQKEMLAGIVSGAASRTELIKKLLSNLNPQVLILVEKPLNAVLRLFHVARSIGDRRQPARARLNVVIHFPALQKGPFVAFRKRTLGNLAGVVRPLLAWAPHCPMPLPPQLRSQDRRMRLLFRLYMERSMLACAFAIELWRGRGLLKVSLQVLKFL
jgi:hypothetical protein